jgi:ComF family protein
MSVIVAPTCLVCHTLLDHPTAGPVCEECWSAVARFTPPLCRICGDPLPAGALSAASDAGGLAPVAEVAAWIGAAGSALAALSPVDAVGTDAAGGPRSAPTPPAHAATCPRCRHAPSLVSQSRAIGEYRSALRAIVHVLKYDKRCSVAPRLSSLMDASAGGILCGADAAIPVPLHWKRKWQRGFNQAAVLASGLHVPVWLALRRVRATRSQVDLPADARRLNVTGAFAIARIRWPWQAPWRARLEGRVVVLVDDVSTTIEACAKVLREAGVREVRAVTAARVVASEARRIAS